MHPQSGMPMLLKGPPDKGYRLEQVALKDLKRSHWHKRMGNMRHVYGRSRNGRCHHVLGGRALRTIKRMIRMHRGQHFPDVRKYSRSHGHHPRPAERRHLSHSKPRGRCHSPPAEQYPQRFDQYKYHNETPEQRQQWYNSGSYDQYYPTQEGWFQRYYDPYNPQYYQPVEDTSHVHGQYCQYATPPVEQYAGDLLAHSKPPVVFDRARYASLMYDSADHKNEILTGATSIEGLSKLKTNKIDRGVGESAHAHREMTVQVPEIRLRQPAMRPVSSTHEDFKKMWSSSDRVQSGLVLPSTGPLSANLQSGLAHDAECQKSMDKVPLFEKLIQVGERVLSYEEDIPLYEKVPSYEAKMPVFEEKFRTFEEKVQMLEERHQALENKNSFLRKKTFTPEKAFSHEEKWPTIVPEICQWNVTMNRRAGTRSDMDINWHPMDGNCKWCSKGLDNVPSTAYASGPPTIRPRCCCEELEKSPGTWKSKLLGKFRRFHQGKNPWPEVDMRLFASPRSRTSKRKKPREKPTDTKYTSTTSIDKNIYMRGLKQPLMPIIPRTP